MVTLLKLATKFAYQLKELYESGTPILDCFAMYIGFMTKFGGAVGEKKLFEITRWQYKDMAMAIYNDKVDYTVEPLETGWNKNRRSGKTKDGTLLSVFYTIIGAEVRWRSAYMKQQDAAKVWWHLNPFVTKINRYDNTIRMVGGDYPIDFAVVTPNNCTGIECDCVFFDEGGWVFKHLQLYEGYKQARPMVAPSKFKHILHLSTPGRGSAFHESWLFLKQFEAERDTTLTSKRVWQDCAWITKEFIEYEEKANFDCPWYVDQNYRGIWTIPGGNVFTNFMDINDPIVPDRIRKRWADMKPTHGGVDFNGDITKHFLILGLYNDSYIFILDEIQFLDLEFLIPYGQNKLISLELEDGLFNEQFTEDTKKLGLICNYNAWDDKSKQLRVREVQKRTTILDKRKCPTVWANLNSGSFDPSSRLPKLLKRPDQHGLDGLLHLMHKKGGKIYTAARKKHSPYAIWQPVRTLV